MAFRMKFKVGPLPKQEIPIEIEKPQKKIEEIPKEPEEEPHLDHIPIKKMVNVPRLTPELEDLVIKKVDSMLNNKRRGPQGPIGPRGEKGERGEDGAGKIYLVNPEIELQEQYTRIVVFPYQGTKTVRNPKLVIVANLESNCCFQILDMSNGEILTELCFPTLGFTTFEMNVNKIPENIKAVCLVGKCESAKIPSTIYAVEIHF